MKKAVRSGLILWVILLGLAFLYSRNAMQWSFEGESLQKIMRSMEEAEADWDASHGLMNLEKIAAQERRDAGNWGTDKTSLEWLDMMPVIDPDKGMNLAWGKYHLDILAPEGTRVSGRVVSGMYQSFIEDGEFSGQTENGTFPIDFTITDTTPQAGVAFSEGMDAVTGIRVTRSHGLFSPDSLAYAVLAGIVGTALIYIYESKRYGREARRDALILLGIAVFAGMPLLWDGVYDGHDLLFHLNRIEGIASGLRCGQFPVRIHASTLIGYGYASPEFYPEAFLYFPAILRILGVSLAVSYKIFLWCIHLATAWICYYSGRQMLKSREAALVGSALYTLSIYRLVNVYTRATLGESLAMVFFPLLILAMYEVLAGDRRKWPLLSISMLGIFMSHLLSTLFCFVFCALAALLHLPKLWREKGRILAIFKAAALVILSSAWFFVPMITYMRTSISTSVVLDPWQHALSVGGLLVGFAGGTGIENEFENFAYSIGVIPGLAIMVGAALCLIHLYSEKEKTGEDRICRTLLLLGGIALFCSTSLFPWEFASTARKELSFVFKQMQFPWRLVGVAAPCLSFAAASAVCRGNGKQMKTAVVISLMILGGIYTMQHTVEAGPVLPEDGIASTRLDQFEYMYPYTEKEALETGDLAVRGLTPYELTEYQKHGTEMRFTLAIEPGEYLVEAPLLYYPGYTVWSDAGEIGKVDRGANNVLRFRFLSDGNQAHIGIGFREPVAWRCAEIVSVLGLLLLLFCVRRRAK